LHVISFESGSIETKTDTWVETDLFHKIVLAVPNSGTK